MICWYGLFSHYFQEFLLTFWKSRSSHQRCSVKTGVLRNLGQFTVKHLCQRLRNFIKKRVSGTCVFLRILAKNTFSTEQLRTTASGSLTKFTKKKMSVLTFRFIVSEWLIYQFVPYFQLLGWDFLCSVNFS